MSVSYATELGSMIQRRPGVNGGRPCVRGTGLSVIQLGSMLRYGFSAEAICAEYAQVEAAGIYAALAYYLANREAFDAEIDAEVAEYERAAAEALAARTR